MRVVFAIISAVVLTAVIFMISAPTEKKVVWSDADSRNLGGYQLFLILGFPKLGSVDEKLNRAIIIDYRELQNNPITYVRNDGSQGTIDVKNVCFDLPFPLNQSYLDRLNSILELWGDETDWREVKWDLKSQDSNGSYVLLQVQTKRGRSYYFEYLVNHSGEIMPKLILFGP
ncbi:hypothetical protein SH668x_003220 [Planctomicrobium sp. SH668]|uniref:hypothetical protein n=1 Tax=Planctomicrobium sp. SH668 TaxID=3448126 RepID=UPI003F5B3442